jgi:peptide-methionine (S)-S-oxide reductase
MRAWRTLFLVACLGGWVVTSLADMNQGHTETAVFGGGCFWCLDAQFRLIPGVDKVTSGYAGGKTPNPTYEQVCSDQTGHAEVIQVEFDPTKVSYEDLLRKFFKAHDPTTLNRQGADVGTQYRSIILYTNDAQKMTAEKVKGEVQSEWPHPIVTEIVPLTHFYAAAIAV